MRNKDNNKGFTLIELLATIIILGIVVGFTVVGTSAAFKNAKKKSEDVFVKTITDALDMFIDSDARNGWNYTYTEYKKNGVAQCIDKTHKKGVKVYITSGVTFYDVIYSSFSPIGEEDMVNPANETKCEAGVPVNIYRDDDYVYYYEVNKNTFNCLVENTGKITNLPTTKNC